MKNTPEQFNPDKVAEMSLKDFFEDAEKRKDPYSKREQELLQNYIDQMISLKGELGIKSFEELKKSDFTKGKDLPKVRDLLKKLSAIMEKIKDAMTEHKFEKVGQIVGKTESGEEIRFEISEQLEYWKNFYEKYNIDWIELPEKIEITLEQQEEMARVIKELKPEKEEDIEILIIPEGLADDGDKYEALHREMTKGYGDSYQFEDFIKDGSFRGLKNKSDRLRIIITKKVQKLKDDSMFAETLGKSVDDLEVENGIFKKKGLRGLNMASYLVLQRNYFEMHKKHLDEAGRTETGWTWITEQVLSESGRVPFTFWDPDVGCLCFGSFEAYDPNVVLMCRLAGSFEIESNK